jgi:iturin family lipopeptide synthetase B/iturin family lipopeptide synthetase C
MLYAYISWTKDNKNNNMPVSRLRALLSREVPAYMIPAHFIRVDAFPLTHSGKVDRKALRSMGERLPAGEEFSPAKSETEKILAEAWKEVLNIERVGINDNFFEVGGNSINIVAIALHLKEKLGKEAPLAGMFRYPTIALFAKYLDETPEPVKKEREFQVDKTKQRLKQRRSKGRKHTKAGPAEKEKHK